LRLWTRKRRRRLTRRVRYMHRVITLLDVRIIWRFRIITALDVVKVKSQ
jgi:hypothetical protein